MTKGATAFVTPLTFQTMSRNRVYVDTFDEPNPSRIAHIEVADRADLVVVAPATANIIGKLASGISDDMLSTVLMATTAPVMLAPAMNVHMIEHPAVKQNMATLAAWGYYFLEPGSGLLACGYTGRGRMSEPEEIVQAIEAYFNGTLPLTSPNPDPALALRLKEQEVRPGKVSVGGGQRVQDEAEAHHQQGQNDVLNAENAQGFSRSQAALLGGKTVLITAGPTREPIDPVRYLTNRSSGKMGYALARAATELGARRVILVSGPVDLSPPEGVDVVRVERAEEMLSAVQGVFLEVDWFIGAAAVSDYQMKEVAGQKLKKTSAGETLTLELVRTPDILTWAGWHRRPGQLIVGFAAETEMMATYAQKKLVEKRSDIIVANDVSREDRGFHSEQNAVTVYYRDGKVEDFALMDKSVLADKLLRAFYDWHVNFESPLK
ncbi:MAG: Phosphopantothenoylcysteine decarboxylase [Candidatus Carbobacillus altaicus]|uniref:Coenzyme A biosynthesis bifunctional protein CoaBC n=1 Tax=Candidatus Carbonibacillus altaicus TaxID=2163959 RepID=A0A2R6Y127_9BACL|nr:MAG: Phosphopantothenoylcysteine decarboxylase [Candidatus Carbobacillus altaicus]